MPNPAQGRAVQGKLMHPAPSDEPVFLDRLVREREAHCFPVGTRDAAREWLDRLLGFLFPHYAEYVACEPEAVAAEMEQICGELTALVTVLTRAPAGNLACQFLDRLPAVYDKLQEDAEEIEAGDPAARSRDEVILSYPGFFAIAVYRLAHELYDLGVPILPRLLTEFAHQQTGIDIHPGAKIGRRFFIDHGTGVVIGETTIIGDRVKLYQGVTLGALVVKKALADAKRHPTLESDVIVYSGATILGGKTVIGAGSVIGGNVWLTRSIPPRSVVTARSEVHIRNPEEPEESIEFYI